MSSTHLKELKPHPSCLGVHPIINVTLKQAKEDLILSFFIEDPDKLILWPEQTQNIQRRNFLWQQTCFELFVVNSEDAITSKNLSYQEWNFSPSQNWQAYNFSGHRSPNPPEELKVTHPPTIQSETNTVKIKIPSLILKSESLVSPTAMIQLKDKTLLPYALIHNQDTADFHSRKTFSKSSTFLNSKEN